jgi:hypothetical protein
MAAMKFLSMNIGVFKKLITESAIELVKISIDLSESKNAELREAGSQLLGSII